MIKVKLIRSIIRRSKVQVLWARSLGLSRVNDISVLNDTPQVRGLIRRLSHCVIVVE